MKILHIIESLSSGGAERLVSELAPIMNEMFQTEILLFNKKNIFFEENLIKKNIKIIYLPFKSRLNPLNILAIRNIIIREKYDVVHSHLFPSNYFTSIASKLIFSKKPRFITTEHSTHNNRRKKIFFRLIEKYIYTSYKIVISISDATNNNLINWIRPKAKDKEKFIVIQNGINIEKFANAKKYEKKDLDSRLNDSDKILCMVGNFSIQKDQATIIKSMKLLPKNVYLILVGDGPQKLKLENLAINEKVSDRVIFLGSRKDVPQIFKTSDIVIVSSNWEGFGLVAIEGMASRKPVIASNVPGLAEVVQDAGMLFDKSNEKDLSNKVIALLENKDLYHKTVALCFLRAKEFSISKMSKFYIDQYLKVL
jgi:glycosyltransferase involved in cell wall biosynthesis